MLETFAFERMSLAKMELTDPDAAFFMSSASAVPAALATSAEPLSAERLDEERAEEKAYSTRLMIIVISGTHRSLSACAPVSHSCRDRTHTHRTRQRWRSWPRDCRTWARA